MVTRVRTFEYIMVCLANLVGHIGILVRIIQLP